MSQQFYDIITYHTENIFRKYLRDEQLEQAKLVQVHNDRLGSIFNHAQTEFNLPAFDQIVAIYQVIPIQQTYPIEQIATIIAYKLSGSVEAQTRNNRLIMFRDREGDVLEFCPAVSIIFKDRNFDFSKDTVGIYRTDRFHPPSAV